MFKHEIVYKAVIYLRMCKIAVQIDIIKDILKKKYVHRISESTIVAYFMKIIENVKVIVDSQLKYTLFQWSRPRRLNISRLFSQDHKKVLDINFKMPAIVVILKKYNHDKCTLKVTMIYSCSYDLHMDFTYNQMSK